MEYGLEFAESVGVLDETDVRYHKAACLHNLTKLAIEQANQILDERPALVFLRILQEGLASGNCWLADRKSGRLAVGRDGPGTLHLGWIDADGIYLLPEKTLGYVFERLKHRSGLPASPSAIKDALKQEGYALQNPSEIGRVDAKKRCGGSTQRVIWLRNESVLACPVARPCDLDHECRSELEPLDWHDLKNGSTPEDHEGGR